MKISKIFNENKFVAGIAYIVFKQYHRIKRKLKPDKGFNLLGDLPVKFYVPFHPIPESNLFGHIEMLKKYIGYKNDLINVHVQHGVILGNLVQKIMINSFASTIVTYSNIRQKIIAERTGKKVVAIGPYIKYAKSRLNQEALESMKNKFGKTLLVFPAHSSVDRTKINFDQVSLINKIREIQELHHIKTVLINLFYSDCTKDSIEYYEDKGFKVCSAGYWLSDNFLHNLRTIIELSDITMSNRVGTHVGYSICLGKPHFIYKQDYKEDFLGKKGLDDLNQVAENKKDEDVDNDEIEKAFISEDFIISKDQIAIVEKYWGSNIVLSPEEMFNILKSV